MGDRDLPGRAYGTIVHGTWTSDRPPLECPLVMRQARAEGDGWALAAVVVASPPESAVMLRGLRRRLAVSQAKVEIVKEAKRIEEDSLYSSKGHFAAAAFWSNFHYWVGLPSAVLAAIAAASALNGAGVVAGVIAIVIAALTAISTFTNPNQRASVHLSAANNYDALKNTARIFWTIDCWLERSDQVLTEQVKGLSRQKDKLNESCPQIPGWAFRRARKGVEAGEGLHSVDKGQ